MNTEIQAPDRTQKMLSMQPGLPERRTHDYVRHGTSTLFAAEVATGKVAAACKPRHRQHEFLAFLKQVARADPADGRAGPPDRAAPDHGQLRHPQACRGPRLARRLPTDQGALHPTSGSWLNLVEVWFGSIDKQAIRRGVFGSVNDLNAKIRAFIDAWNDRAHPFVWTKTADDILEKANRQQTSEARY